MKYTIKTYLYGILLITLALKIYCSLDGYLHEWDERYHALVAKNLIQNPLQPTLYLHAIEPYDYTNWVGNHIWLSKPPLPLWFMAISLKLFGFHAFVVRIPAIIFSVLGVLLTFKMASRLFSPKVGLVAAFLHGIHGMLTDLASGRLSSDGVETCFLFFISLGMYQIFSKASGLFKLTDYVITGVITGLALMSKWQPAFLILVILFVFHFETKHWLKHIWFCAISFACSLVVLAPWAIHCWLHFPMEARWMAEAIFHPMTIKIAGNDGTWYSYITDFGHFFGYPTYLCCLAALFIAWKGREKKMFALLTWVIFPFVIFSMAEIKRGTYLMIFAPAVFILIAYFVMEKFHELKIAKYIRYAALISAASILVFSVEKLYLFSPDKSRERKWSLEIEAKSPPPGAVIYDEPHAIEMMFYHDVTAYSFSKK